MPVDTTSYPLNDAKVFTDADVMYYVSDIMEYGDEDGEQLETDASGYRLWRRILEQDIGKKQLYQITNDHLAQLIKRIARDEKGDESSCTATGSKEDLMKEFLVLRGVVEESDGEEQSAGEESEEEDKNKSEKKEKKWYIERPGSSVLIETDTDPIKRAAVVGELEVLYEKPINIGVWYMLHKQNLNIVLQLKHLSSSDKIKWYKDVTQEEKIQTHELLEKAWNWKGSEIEWIKLKREISTITKVMGEAYFRDVNLTKCADLKKLLNKKISSITFNFKDLLVKREFKDFEIIALFPRVLTVVGVVKSNRTDDMLKILQNMNRSFGNKHIVTAMEQIVVEFLLDRVDHANGFLEYLDVKIFNYCQKAESEFLKNSNSNNANGKSNQGAGNWNSNANGDAWNKSKGGLKGKGKGKYGKRDHWGKGNRDAWGHPYGGGKSGWFARSQWSGDDWSPSGWGYDRNNWYSWQDQENQEAKPGSETNAKKEQEETTTEKGKGKKGKGKQ